MAFEKVEVNLEGIDLKGQTVWMCADNEKYGRRPGPATLASVGLAVGIPRDDGSLHLIAKARFSLSWTEHQIDKATREEYFDKNPELLPQYLSWVDEAHEWAVEHFPWAFVDMSGDKTRNNPACRTIVNHIQTHRIAHWIDYIERLVHELGGSVEIASDFCEFDVADLSALVYDARNEHALMYQAIVTPEGAKGYRYRGAAYNTDHQMARFLPPGKRWGFGSEFAAKFGLTPVVNPSPHLPDADAVAILQEFLAADHTMNALVDRSPAPEE